MEKPEAATQPCIIYPLPDVPIRLEVIDMMSQEGYKLKDEFHVTVSSAVYAAQLSAEKLANFRQLLNRAPGCEIEYEDILYRVSRPKRQGGTTWARHSLVAPVYSDELQNLLKSITSDLAVPMPESFMHVTLFTSPDTAVASKGIGIYSEADWKALKPVEKFLGWLAV